MYPTLSINIGTGTLDSLFPPGVEKPARACANSPSRLACLGALVYTRSVHLVPHFGRCGNTTWKIQGWIQKFCSCTSAMLVFWGRTRSNSCKISAVDAERGTLVGG